MTTPATSYFTPFAPTISSPSSISYDLLGLTSLDDDEKELCHVPKFGMHRSHVPHRRRHPLHLITRPSRSQSISDMDDRCGRGVDDDGDDLE